MAKNPVSQVPNNGQNRGEIIDLKDVIQYFGSFKLADSQTTNAAIAPPPQQLEQDAANNAKNIKKQRDVVEQASHKFLPKQEQVVRQNHGEDSFRGLVDKRDCNGGVFEPEFVGLGNSRKQPLMESAYGYPSTSNCENPSVRSGVVDKLSVIPNYGVGYGYMDDRGVESFAMERERPSFDLSWLQEILNGGDDSEISMLVVIFQGSYLDLMSNRTLSNVFQKLLDYCKGDLLDSVVAEVLSCTQRFTNAAFSEYGASSIIKLIKSVKKSSHASSIAQALSTQFLAIMTHETARTVIQHCFNYFPNNSNEMLYEKAIVSLKELATDKVGCRSLDEVMSRIAGKQRSRLLNEIVELSYYLSYHPIGNYVVQNVLSLKKKGVSGGIVRRLQGKCVELAKQQGGSGVVEKCIEASEFGMVCVVREIVETPKASMELAQNLFGSYVIQTALNKTKKYRYTDLHCSLLNSLQAYCTQLNPTLTGNMVHGLLTDGVDTK